MPVCPKKRAVLSRVLFEFQLLPFDPVIGDGNGEVGVFAMGYDPFLSDDMTFDISFDASTYRSSVDTTLPEKSLSPLDPAIRDQCHFNLTSASDTEVFLRSVSESSSTAASPKPQEQDLFKKHSSIGRPLSG